MRRFSTFLFGMIAGGLLIYAALSYHVVQTSEGLHLVPKLESSLAATYVDVRGLGPAQLLQQHPLVAQAILASGRTDLIESTAADALQGGLDRLLERLPSNQ